MEEQHENKAMEDETKPAISNINNWITGILVASFLGFGSFLATKVWDLEGENDSLANRVSIFTATSEIKEKQYQDQVSGLISTVEQMRAQLNQNSNSIFQNKASHDELERRFLEQSARHDAEIEQLKKRLDACCTDGFKMDKNNERQH